LQLDGWTCPVDSDQIFSSSGHFRTEGSAI